LFFASARLSNRADTFLTPRLVVAFAHRLSVQPYDFARDEAAVADFCTAFGEYPPEADEGSGSVVADDQ